MRAAITGALLLAAAPAIAQVPSRVETTVAGRPFVVMGRPDNVRTIRYAGEDWIQVKVWPGDRRPEDAVTIDRVGLDGWVKPYRWGSTVDLSFRFILRDNSLPEKGAWLVLYEAHEKGWNGVGFIRLVLENGSGRPVLRLRAGDAILWADDRPQLWSPYKIRLRFTAGGAGVIQAWSYGRQVADWKGVVGHAPAHPLYPQFRIYRNTERRIGIVLLKVDQHDEIGGS